MPGHGGGAPLPKSWSDKVELMLTIQAGSRSIAGRGSTSLPIYPTARRRMRFSFQLKTGLLSWRYLKFGGESRR